MRNEAANGMGITTSINANSIKQIRDLAKKVILFSIGFFYKKIGDVGSKITYLKELTVNCRFYNIGNCQKNKSN